MSDDTSKVQGGEKAGKAGYHWLGPVLVALIGAFMSILDSSIVNVAVPSIMKVFGVGASDVQWVATVYLLALGVVVPLAGWLGDRLGFKRLYMISMAVFAGGSLLCTTAWSLNALVVARAIQAIGGGMIMPTTMAMVFRMVPRENIGSGMGIFGISLLVAPAIGPTLGGYLVEFVNWRWIFTINLPIAVIGILLAWFVLPEFQSKHPGKFDAWGAVTSAGGLFCVLLALSKGSDWGWGSETTVMLFVVAAALLGLFVCLELTSDNPLLELRVFKDRTFTMANLSLSVTSICMYAALFYLPLFLQSFRGLGAMETGLLMMPGALVSGAMMPVVGRLFDKLGPRPLVIFGLLLLAFLTYLFHNLSLVTATSTVTIWVMLRGFVMPLANMPAQTAALVDLPAEMVGRASALTNIIGRVSSSLGLSVLTTILNNRQAYHSSHIAWTVGLGNNAVSPMLARVGAAMGGGSRGRAAALAYIQGTVTQKGFVNAIDDVFVITAAFAIVALVPALFLKKGAAARARGPLVAE